MSPAVIGGVHRSHPVIVDAVSYQGSANYAGRARAESMFVAELPDLVGPSIATAVSAHNVDRLQTYIRPELVAGLPDDEAARLAVASLRLALSSLHRGVTKGTGPDLEPAQRCDL